MIARPRLAALLLSASLVVVASCGDDTTTPVAADSLPAASTVPRSAPATTATAAGAAATTAAASDAECATERKALEVAVEAFFAQYGRPPATEAELVGDFLRSEIGSYDLVADTGEIVRVAGVACDDTGSDADAEPITVEEVLDEFGPDGVEQFGGIECATELAEIVVAGEAFIAREGREPESLLDLRDDLGDIELWAFDDERETLVPASGSPCVDIEAATARTEADICDTEANTLAVAAEAYTAQYGTPPSEDDLVGEFLIEPAERFDLDADGAVIPVPGGECDPAVTAVTTAP